MLENMLDYIRITLYTLLIVIAFFIYQAWEKEHPTLSAPDKTVQASVSTMPTVLPTATSETSAATGTAALSSTASAAKGQLIKVDTDVMTLNIDTRGGDVVGSQLLKYPESLHSKVPFVLLSDDPKDRYIAESGLLSQMGPDTTQEQALYTVENTQYTMQPGQNELNVVLNWQNAAGVKVAKIFTFTRGSYEIKVTYQVDNQSKETWQGNLFTQLMRTNTPPANHGGMVNLTTYFGAGISTPDKRFEKISFKDMQDKSLNLTAQNGWAAMIQHYFISAWVPPQNATSTYYSRFIRTSPADLYTIGMMGAPVTVKPGETWQTQTKLYSGPAISDELKKTAPWLQLTIDYGWFWFISVPVFWMLQTIHSFIGNWGWSIVIVTILIKLLFYPLSSKSYRSMSGLKRLQPKIEALKERYGDDRQKMTEATLALYKEEKVNPMSGCLPILIQIPVFIALYWVLVESVELRQAPFILWIHDLSQQDPYYVLPILMGLSMFVQQRLNPPPPDPMQAKVMMAMPFVFTFLFAKFPAGLMLYWFVNNTLSFLQQWYIMHKIDKEANGKVKK
jgi:YidC/Oxa1 family membrane protein insertase